MRLYSVSRYTLERSIVGVDVDVQGEVIQHAEVLRLIGEVGVDVRGGVIGGHVNSRFVRVGHFDGPGILTLKLKARDTCRRRGNECGR